MQKTLLFIIILLGAIACSSDDELSADEARAIQAAEDWLALVDRDDEVGSWQAASELFQNEVTLVEWAGILAEARSNLGTQLNRRILAALLVESIQGLPPGSYYIIEFEASYELLASAVERVTTVKEGDGVWRVVGYFLVQ